MHIITCTDPEDDDKEYALVHVKEMHRYLQLICELVSSTHTRIRTYIHFEIYRLDVISKTLMRSCIFDSQQTGESSLVITGVLSLPSR